MPLKPTIALPSLRRLASTLPRLPQQASASTSAAASSSSSASSSSASTAEGPSGQLPARALKARRLREEANANRVFTDRKAYLYKYYNHLLGSSDVVLLFAHGNLTVSQFIRIRRAVAAVKLKAPPAPASQAEDGSAAPEAAEPAKLTVVRTGVFSALAKSPDAAITPLRPFLKGPVALLTCAALTPDYLGRVNKAIEGALKKMQKDKLPDGSEPKQPTMRLIGGVLESGRVVGAEELATITKLPDLQVLRGQVVGMLEQQGRGLLGLLSQAAGGGLVRTLQGLEESLKADGGAEEAKP